MRLIISIHHYKKKDYIKTFTKMEIEIYGLKIV